MAKLGKRFFEIGRGYRKVSEHYNCPYLLGVDIKDKDRPFVVATGDTHGDSAASLVSVEELISGVWDEHILRSNCIEFIEKLKNAINQGDTFPQKFILDMINNKK